LKDTTTCDGWTIVGWKHFPSWLKWSIIATTEF
jgi:hypothetical protein